MKRGCLCSYKWAHQPTKSNHVEIASTVTACTVSFRNYGYVGWFNGPFSSWCQDPLTVPKLGIAFREPQKTAKSSLKNGGGTMVNNGSWWLMIVNDG